MADHPTENPGPPPYIEVIDGVGGDYLEWTREALLYLLNKDSGNQPLVPHVKTLAYQAPWRTGRRVHRTIYATQPDRQVRDNDPLIGVMDTPELAREAVAAHNNRLSRAAGR